jgi:DNA repair ATPase RecN
MAKNPQSKDEALEALDFIVNVLKEHERDLDKLINELATVTEQMGNNDELTGKVDKVEEKINSLQNEVANLAGYITNAPRQATVAPTMEQKPVAQATLAAAVVLTGPSMVMHCKQWEDFQNLAAGAQTVSFSFKEDEKVFQADAVRGNQVISYSGALPKFSTVLKAFLSKELGVSERCILEGTLARGQ